nr:tripartite tricarboxylate transporter substrate binding protein [Brachybacterium sacelli]
MTRRHALAAAPLTAAALAGCSRGESASGGSTTMIVPFAPGGGSDQSGRALADGLERATGDTVSVENIQGGSGAIGYSEFLGMHGDGSKLLATETALMALALTQDVRFSYEDFTPIFKAGDDFAILVTRPDADYGTGMDLVDAARERSILVGVSGATSLDEILFSLIEGDQQMEFDRVPYESGGEVLAALLGGHIEAGLLNPSEVLGQLQSGDLKALCALAYERYEADELADIPTGLEQGLDVAFAQFRAVIAPGGIDEEARQRWVEAAREYAGTEEYRTYLADNFLVEAPLYDKELGEYFEQYNEELAEAFT